MNEQQGYAEAGWQQADLWRRHADALAQALEHAGYFARYAGAGALLIKRIDRALDEYQTAVGKVPEA